MDADPNLGGALQQLPLAAGDDQPLRGRHRAGRYEPPELPGPAGRHHRVHGDGRRRHPPTTTRASTTSAFAARSEDLGRDDTAPASTPEDRQREFENPLDGNKPFPLSYVALGQSRRAEEAAGRRAAVRPARPQDPPARTGARPPGHPRQLQGADACATAKFTGPYFHNGDSATLRQVVEFYTRGGNFPNTNFRDLDPDIEGIPGLRFPEFLPAAQRNMHDLIDFVSEGLTDAAGRLGEGAIRPSAAVRSERNGGCHARRGRLPGGPGRRPARPGHADRHLPEPAAANPVTRCPRPHCNGVSMPAMRVPQSQEPRPGTPNRQGIESNADPHEVASAVGGRSRRCGPTALRRSSPCSTPTCPRLSP